MSVSVDLERMTVPDKLRLMEAIWRDLSQNECEIVSPEWHLDVLEERERKIASGEDSLLDWEIAKQKLREKLQ